MYLRAPVFLFKPKGANMIITTEVALDVLQFVDVYCESDGALGSSLDYETQRVVTGVQPARLHGAVCKALAALKYREGFTSTTDHTRRVSAHLRSWESLVDLQRNAFAAAISMMDGGNGEPDADGDGTTDEVDE